jgi:hypothetical protein
MATPVSPPIVPARSLHQHLAFIATKLCQVTQLCCCVSRTVVTVRGRSAIERMLRLQRYSRTTSERRISVLIALSPLPVLVLLLVVDVSTPLSDPRLGPTHNTAAFARSVVANAIIALCSELLMFQALGIPIRPGLAVSASGLALFIAAAVEVPWIVAAFTLEYPVPSKHYLNGPSLLVVLSLCAFTAFKSPAASRWAWRRRVVRSALAVVVVRIIVASLLSITATQFVAAPLWGRVLLLLVVRVAKMHYQQQLNVLVSRLPGASIETAAVSGEAVFAVFHIACFQAEPSIWLVLGLVAVDAVEVGVHMRTISQLSLELKRGSQIWSIDGLTRSAITATSISDRADADRPADEDDELPMPSTPMELVPRYSHAPEISIEFPREVIAAPPRIRVSRSAKIYCAQHKNTLVIRMHPLPSRNSAPSIVGNCTLDLPSIQTSSSPSPRANEPPSAAIQRRQSGRSSRQSVSEGRSRSRSTSKSGVSIKKRRGSGESTRLRDLIASCETLLLEKFTALLLLVIYGGSLQLCATGLIQ